MTRHHFQGQKGQRSRSPGRFTHRRVAASASCSGQRGNVLAVGNYCSIGHVASACSARRFGAHRGKRGAGAYRGGRPPTACLRLFSFYCLLTLLSYSGEMKLYTIHSSTLTVHYARVIYGGRRDDHVTPLLRDNLHWLRIRERITFKLCLLVYTWPCTILHRRHVHPGRHRVNTTIAPL